MAYYKDLSEYEYYGYNPTLYNVGWLDGNFSKGEVSKEFLDKLKKHKEYIQQQMMGSHCCPYCLSEKKERSNGELWVVAFEGQVYSSPVMIIHYIEEHKYLPPQEFIDAVLYGEEPGSLRYNQKIEMTKHCFLILNGIKKKKERKVAFGKIQNEMVEEIAKEYDKQILQNILNSNKMQAPKLKLKEIIWEITGRCENGCSYCGSKDQWKEGIYNETILKIADKICEYPPEEIDISGGDPLLIDREIHSEIIHKFHSAGINAVKILVNPKSFKKTMAVTNIIELYDWVGVSINTEEELNIFKPSAGYNIMMRTTVISNFNTTNLYMFEYIKEFVKNNNLQWQIQLTMTNKTHEAIYKSDLAFETLSSYIRKALDEGVKIICADNLNGAACGAGIQSLGILSNGDVVPCLSMRSWFKDIKEVVVGNVLDDGGTETNILQMIWENKFLDIRFRGFHCCKDECGNKCFNYNQFPKPGSIVERWMKQEKEGKVPNLSPKDTPKQPIQNRLRGVMAYAVSMEYYKPLPGAFSTTTSNGDNVIINPEGRITYLDTVDYCKCKGGVDVDSNNICTVCHKPVKLK